MTNRTAWTEYEIQRCREMAAAGLSQKFAAQQLGCSLNALHYRVGLLDIHFQKMAKAERQKKVGHLMLAAVSGDRMLVAAKAALRRDIEDAKAAIARDDPPVYRRWPEGT